MIIMTMTLMS